MTLRLILPSASDTSVELRGGREGLRSLDNLSYPLVDLSPDVDEDDVNFGRTSLDRVSPAISSRFNDFCRFVR